MSLEQGNQLANAIRINKDNTSNKTTTSFDFSDLQLDSKVFQPIWDALLDSRVRKLYLNIRNNNNNNNINFTGFSTNTSIEELCFSDGRMPQQDRMNLYDAIKVNKILEKLQIYYYCDHVLEEKEQKSSKGMLLGNISLTNVTLTICDKDGIQQVLSAAYDDLKKKSVIHTELNRKYIRYTIMLREAKTAAAAAITRTTTAIIAPPSPTYVVKEQKRFMMRVLFHAFEKKPILRDAIIFSYLTEYYDVFDNDSYKETNRLYRMLYNLRGEEEKSMYDYINYNSIQTGVDKRKSGTYL